MLEINTLVRFLRKEPDLHTELWEAEGERTALALVDEHKRLHEAGWGPRELTRDAVEEKKVRVAEARRKALAAKVPGVSAGSGSVLPSIAHQLKVIDEPAASEAYTWGYRPTGWDTHSGARAFVFGDWIERNDGTMSYHETKAPEDQLGSRALAVTCFGSTLELAAIVLPLPIESEARAIVVEYTPQTRDDAARGRPAPSAIPVRQEAQGSSDDPSHLSAG